MGAIKAKANISTNAFANFDAHDVGITSISLLSMEAIVLQNTVFTLLIVISSCLLVLRFALFM